MKTFALALAGACALAIPSAANATLSITSPTTPGVSVTGPNPVNAIEWTFGFVDTNSDSPFSDTVSWTNDLAGEYAFRVITNATAANGPDDVDFTAVFVTGTGILSPISLIADPGNTDLRELFTLEGLGLTAGTFTLTVQGVRGDSSVLGGHVTADAVPEPATWAMMLLGFGAIGFAARRSRKKAALAQIA